MEVGNLDHVHCFVSAPPKLSISKIVKILKGTSARLLFIQFPELKTKLYKHTLWNPSYYVETIGCISESVVKKYIENQSKQNGGEKMSKKKSKNIKLNNKAKKRKKAVKKLKMSKSVFFI